MRETKSTSPARCLTCGRILRAAKSIANGRGPTCRAKVAAAAKVIDLSAFKDAKAARDKAEQLIADNAIVPTRLGGQYLATSSDGLNTYLVDSVERSCTCRGHIRVGRCYHLVAADILTAA